MERRKFGTDFSVEQGYYLSTYQKKDTKEEDVYALTQFEVSFHRSTSSGRIEKEWKEKLACSPAEPLPPLTFFSPAHRRSKSFPLLGRARSQSYLLPYHDLRLHLR